MQPTPMNPAKLYLLGYRSAMLNLDNHIREYNRLSSQYDRIRQGYERATKATSSMTALRVSGTPQHDSMANAVLEIVDLKKNIESHRGECDGSLDWLLDDMQRLAEAGKERLDVIDQVEDHRLRALLYMRYFMPKMTWVQLAFRLSEVTKEQCGVDNAYKLHGKALAEVRRIIGE